MRAELLERLLEARSAKRPVVLVTDLASGEQWLHDPAAAGPAGPAPEACDEALRADRPGRLEAAGRELFLNVFQPPLRLVVVGAVHIAQSLAPMAALAGFEVHVVDPRESFAAALRFPGVSLSTRWPDEGLRELVPDARTAVVTLTHDPKLDDPALAVALRSEAFYIGCLGSRRTQARRLERLRAQGFGETALARLHGPVGLDIGARSPAEIAVSIVAEVVAELRRGR